MDDPRLNNLLQHAAEVEAFERDLVEGVEVGEVAPGRTRNADPAVKTIARGTPLRVIAWGTFAAAAGLALMVSLFPTRTPHPARPSLAPDAGIARGTPAPATPSPVTPDTPRALADAGGTLAGTPAGTRSLIDTPHHTPRSMSVAESPEELARSAPEDRPMVIPVNAGDEGHMLIALYSNDGHSEACDSCWCIERWDPSWDHDQELTTVAAEMLIDESILRSCVEEPARVVVVGLSGPAEALPTSDEEARTLAMCLLECADPEFVDRFALPPARGDLCLGSDVDFRIQTWSR